MILGRRNCRLYAFLKWLNKTRKNKNEQCDKSRDNTIDANCVNDKKLKEDEVKRREDTDERHRLEQAAQETINKDEFQGGENEQNTIEHNTELCKRYAENTRILACCDDIATRKILDITEERRTARLVLYKIQRIRESKKGEDQDSNNTEALHEA